jgi:hypothetical protein
VEVVPEADVADEKCKYEPLISKKAFHCQFSIFCV